LGHKLTKTDTNTNKKSLKYRYVEKERGGERAREIKRESNLKPSALTTLINITRVPKKNHSQFGKN